MPIDVQNLEWLNHNAQRHYPLTEESGCWDSTETFRIPQDFLVSLYFPVPWSQNVLPGNFFVSRVASYATGYQVTIGYQEPGEDGEIIPVATALIARITHYRNKPYILTGMGDYAGSRGSIVIGNLDTIAEEPSGVFVFNLADTRLETDAIRPQLQGITHIQFQNGNELSQLFSGVVKLRAGRNTRFRVEYDPADVAIVYWDAIDGAGLTEQCVCDQGLAPPLRTINGFSALDGNLQILGNDCLEWSGQGNRLVASDVCSEPCCGCTELERITQALESFGSRAATLESFLVSLEARVSQADAVMLGSRLGDRGCTPARECP